jgi:hypothetical protein
LRCKNKVKQKIKKIMKKFVLKVSEFLLGLVFLSLMSLVIAYPVMLLWNWVMPEIFGLTTISFWQALGLLLLSGLLIKSN